MRCKKYAEEIDEKKYRQLYKLCKNTSLHLRRRSIKRAFASLSE
jgi:hypothetical protein